MRRACVRAGLLLFLPGMVMAQSAPLAVNPASREEVRQFYRAVYWAAENVPMGWTGDYTTGTAGRTAAAFREATRCRINFYRALAGVPADITFTPGYNAKAQAAALLMSVNGTLSHAPPPQWALYSAPAAEAALSSNLALGQAGPAAIDGYLADPGANNAAAGHRRWLLYPQTLQMGSGDVPGLPAESSVLAANALWVIDATPGGQFGDPRPTTRRAEVAYPPAGFVPYAVVWPRWSFSHPDADFSGATVRMTREGEPVATAIEPPSPAPGEPTLVWVYDHQDSRYATAHARPAADTTYTVNLDNVYVKGMARSFSYQVTVFDPEIPSPDFSPPAVFGATRPAVGAPSTYTVAKPTFADALDWRTVQLTPATKVFSAEAGLEGLIPTTGQGYEVVQAGIVGRGRRAYRLAHVDPRGDQVLLVPGIFHVEDSAAAVVFRSRLAIATPTETARVQISTDEGRSWHEVYAQVGTSPTQTDFPSATEEAFVIRTVSLGRYAGQSINLRLVYSIGLGPAFAPEPTNSVGWFIDDLTVTGVQSLIAGASHQVANSSSFTFAPVRPGPLALQARGVMFGTYAMEWGPPTVVRAIPRDVPVGADPASHLSVRASTAARADTIVVGFEIQGAAKPVLIRGLSPEPAASGLRGNAVEPRLELYRGPVRLAESDTWLALGSAAFEENRGVELSSGLREAVLTVQLSPGDYLAQLSGMDEAAGAALLEVRELP